MSKIVQIVYTGSGPEMTNFMALHEDGALSMVAVFKGEAHLIPLPVRHQDGSVEQVAS